VKNIGVGLAFHSVSRLSWTAHIPPLPESEARKHRELGMSHIYLQKEPSSHPRQDGILEVQVHVLGM
jgi:hypothetical protein